MARPRIEPTDAPHEKALTRWRAIYEKSKEPDLDPIAPLAAAQARRDARTRERRQAQYARQVGRLAEMLVHLLDQANLGTPRPIRYPEPIRRDVFQVRTVRAVPDWRKVLPLPPGPVVIPQRKTAAIHGYGSPARVSYRP